MFGFILYYTLMGGLLYYICVCLWVLRGEKSCVCVFGLKYGFVVLVDSFVVYVFIVFVW